MDNNKLERGRTIAIAAAAAAFITKKVVVLLTLSSTMLACGVSINQGVSNACVTERH